MITCIAIAMHYLLQGSAAAVREKGKYEDFGKNYDEMRGFCIQISFHYESSDIMYHFQVAA